MSGSGRRGDLVSKPERRFAFIAAGRLGETEFNPSWSAKHASEPAVIFFNSLESGSDVVDRHACGKVWG